MKINIYTSLVVLLCFFGGSKVIGQTFTAVSSGDWNVPATWDQNAVPNATNSTSILIGRGYTVTVPGGYSVEANQISVQSKSSLHIASGGTLILVDGSGTDLALASGFAGTGTVTVAGTLVGGNSTSTNSKTTNFTMQNGGVYEHQYTETPGAIPLATWNQGSLLRITGYTTNELLPTNFNQPYSHVEWNTPSLNNLNGIFDLGGQLKTINGNFNIESTGSTYLVFALDASYSLNISGDLNIKNSSLVALAYGNINTGTREVNVGNNFNYTSDQVSFLTDEASILLKIGNQFNLNAGAGGIELLQTFSQGTGTANISVAGNVNWTSGNFYKSGPGTANLLFDGTTVQRYISAISSVPKINYTIASTSTLDLGTSALSGSGNLTVSDNAGLTFGSTAADGAWQNSQIYGNIQVGGTRTYGDYLTVTYNGTAAQKTGLDFPETKNINLIIDNPTTVTPSENITITGTQSLSLNQGTLNIGSTTLTINGSVTSTSGTIGAISTSNLSIGGSGAMGVIPFNSTSSSLNNFSIKRTTAGSVTLGSNLTILGALTLNDGNLILNGNTLILKGTVGSLNGRIESNSNSGLIIQGSGALGAIPFATDSSIKTFVLDRIENGSADLLSNLLVTGLLDLSNGYLNNNTYLTMGTDATIKRAVTSALAVEPNASSYYNVEYMSGLSTDKELPSSPTALGDLKINSTGTINLQKNIVVNDSLYLANGTFNLGTNTVEVKNKLITNSGFTGTTSTLVLNGTVGVSGSVSPAFNNVTISSGSAVNIGLPSFSVSHNWVNDGNVNPGNSIVTFNNNTTISGSVDPNFHSVVIAGTLNAPDGNMNVSGNWMYNSGAFNAATGTITYNGTNQTIAPGGQSFHNIAFAGSGTKSLQSTIDVNGNLVINSGATFSVGTNYPVSVAGNWTNNGAFTGGTATITFDGTAQTIAGTSPSTFYNINANGYVGVNGIANLSNVLTVAQNRTFDADGSGSGIFTLLSTATRTASIATLPSGASVSGNVTAQRYIHGEGNLYRYIGSPLTNTTLAQWNDNFAAVNNTYHYIETYAQNSMFGYYLLKSTSDNIVNGRGYTALVNNGTTPIVIDMRGPVQQNEVTFDVTYTNSGSPDFDGLNLVSNPYPSAISISVPASGETDAWTWQGISPEIAVPNNEAGNENMILQRISRTGGSLNGGSNFIASGQSFWVYANTNSPVLKVTEAAKRNETTTPFYRTKPNVDRMVVGLNHDGLRDETAVLFRNDATAEFDTNLESRRLDNAAFDLATLTSDSVQVAFNFLPLPENDFTLPLTVKDMEKGSFSLDFKGLGTFTKEITLSLVDNYLSTSVPVNEETVYAFEVNDDAASSSQYRFYLTTKTVSSAMEQVSSTECSTEVTHEVTISNTRAGYTYLINSEEGEILSSASGNNGSITLQLNTEALQTGLSVLKVTASNDSDNTTNNLDQINLYKLEEPQIVEEKGTFFVEDLYDSYQWYLNGEMIKEANSPSFAPLENGLYTILVSSGNCDINSSARKYMLTSGQKETKAKEISLNPNPASDYVEITLNGSFGENISYEIMSVNSLKVKEGVINSNEFNNKVNISELPAGMYIMRLEIDGEIVNLRFVKSY